MSLRAKILLIVCMVMAAYAVLAYAAMMRAIPPAFVDLETEAVVQDMDRCVGAVSREIDYLDSTCKDWAAWDDTYQFVKDRNTRYVGANLAKSTFDTNRLNLLYIVDASGSLAWGRAYDQQAGRWTEMAEFPPGGLPPDHFLLRHNVPDPAGDDAAIKGVLVLPERSLLISSRPIVTTEEAGPVVGTFIMARALDAGLVSQFAEQTRVPLRVAPERDVADGAIPPPRDRIVRTGTSVSQEPDGFLHVSTGLFDVTGKHVLALSADMPRLMYAQGVGVARTTFGFILLAEAVILLALLVSVRWFIIGPVARLIDAVADVADSGDPSRRLPEGGGDELGKLTGAVNRMLGAGEAAVAERRRVETRMLQAQKLESLGVMAGSIAHRFNNLLTAVMGNIELVRPDVPDGSSAAECLEDARQAAADAADLGALMLTCVGGQMVAHRPIELGSLVGEMAALLGGSVPNGVRLRFAESERPAWVNGDAGQLRQIVINVVTNAAEAIGDGTGDVTVSVATGKLPSETPADCVEGGSLPDGETVVLTVLDTGPGMDGGTLSRIFDPFFTTKFTGRGLGMAAVLGMVRGHYGAVRVCSHEGQGTRVDVCLPAVEPPESADRTVLGAGKGRDAGGTILLVDDEEMVRAAGKALLEAIGFVVVTAPGGEEAVRIFREEPGKFDCVILDLNMPAMDGAETLSALRAADADVAVVMASGLLPEQVGDSLKGAPPAACVRKPFQMAELAGTLHEVCGRRPAG